MEPDDAHTAGAALASAEVNQGLQAIQAFQTQHNARAYLPGPSLADSVSTAFYFHFRLPYFGQRGFRRRPEVEGDEVTVAEGVEEGAGHYVWLTYGQVWRYFTSFGSGLAQFVHKNDFVGICGRNSIEWAVADLACIYQSFASVPLHTILDDESLEFILNQTEMRCVVCEHSQLPKLGRVIGKCAYLKHVVVMTPPEGKDDEKDKLVESFLHDAAPHGVQVHDFVAVEAQGHREPKEQVERAATDIATIMYTSGTTGKPKGAMMEDNRWNRFVTKPYLMPTPAVTLSHGPLAHVQERQNFYITMCVGGRIAFFDQDMSQLLNEAQLVRPTLFSAVPRIWNFIHSEYQKALDIAVKFADGQSREEIEAEVLARFRGCLGGRLEYIVTGGAATSPHIIRFLEKCFQCRAWNGYGTTETGGISNDNVINSSVAVRLIDVPDLGYTTQDQPNPRGEICVMTDDIIKGYYKDEKATSESFADGWFRTGDIGEYLPTGQVVIIDRKKNIFKLSQGEFVVPEKLENAYIESEFIDQVYVYGGHTRTYLVAVVVPNREVLHNWLNGSAAPEAKVWEVNPRQQQDDINHPLVKSKLLEEMQRIATRLNFASFEVPRAVHVDAQRFTAENCLLTASLKLCRGKLEKRYQAELASMYDGAEEAKEDQVIGLLSSALAGEPISDHLQSMTLAQLGLDSLSTVNLVSLVRERFGRDVPLRALFASPTIRDLVGFLRTGHIGSSSSTGGGGGDSGSDKPHPAWDDLQPDAHLLQLGDATQGAEGGGEESGREALLTGVTGFLGVHLLQALLPHYSRVHCLVRCPDAAAGRKRLEGVLAEHSVEGIDAALLDSRVVVWPADLALPSLGLAPGAFDSLAGSVSAIYHCGAVVNWLHPYETLRAPNVLGTLALLQLCTTGRGGKRFHHVSTIGVADAPQGDEDSMWPAEWLSALSGYSLSKWVAEHFVRQAAAQGVDVRVYRPGMVAPHTRTGASNPDDYLNRYMVGVVGLGSYIEADGFFDITPVDYVAAAIVALGEMSSAGAESLAGGGGGVPSYHLTNPRSGTYAQLGHHIAAAVASLTPPPPSGADPVAVIRGAPYGEWRAALLRSIRQRKEGNALYGLLPYFSESFGEQLQRQTRPFPCDKTLQAVAGLGLECPPVTQELVAHFLASLHRRGFLPSTAGAYLVSPPHP